MFKAACVNNQIDVLDYMMTKGIDARSPGLSGMIAYVITEKGTNDCYRAVSFLIQHGFDLNEQVLPSIHRAPNLTKF